MKKKHNSHYIFLLLGLLILLFVIIFGVRYFQSEYSFSDAGISNNTQDYNDGVAVENPFTDPVQENRAVPTEIIPLTDPSIENYVPGE